MLSRIGKWARGHAERIDPFTNVVGAARSILALASAITLAANPTWILFHQVQGIERVPRCDGLRALGPFCVAPSDHLEVARWLAVAALLVVASGWRPRITGMVHFWIAFGVQSTATIVDGGDQVASILAMLLLPVTLLDGRRWHWQSAERRPMIGWEPSRRVIALASLLLIRLQVAGIYWHAAQGKSVAVEWDDGTALYYWLTSSEFGAPPWLQPLLHPLLLTGVTVAFMTWGIIVLEFLLSAGLLVSRTKRAPLLAAGIALHVGIILVHGLVSFGLIMVAALILFLRPVDMELGIARSLSKVSLRGRRAIWRRGPVAATTECALDPTS